MHTAIHTRARTLPHAHKTCMIHELFRTPTTSVPLHQKHLVVFVFYGSPAHRIDPYTHAHRVKFGDELDIDEDVEGGGRQVQVRRGGGRLGSISAISSLMPAVVRGYTPSAQPIRLDPYT